jgi:hypothetical protein
MTTTESTATDRDTPETSLLALLVLAGLTVLAVAVLTTFVYGVAYEVTDSAVVETTDTSGVIEMADAPEGRSFVVTFDGPIAEGGPTEVTVIDPAGEMKYRAVLVPGVERVELPEDEVKFAGFEYETGEYEVVATHGNDVHGRASVEISSRSLLPFVPLWRLFQYGLGVGVLVVVFVGGVIRGGE